jgi:hypothetical protein
MCFREQRSINGDTAHTRLYVYFSKEITMGCRGKYVQQMTVLLYAVGAQSYPYASLVLLALRVVQTVESNSRILKWQSNTCCVMHHIICCTSLRSILYLHVILLLYTACSSLPHSTLSTYHDDCTHEHNTKLCAHNRKVKSPQNNILS